jgi:hypothetical protein
MQKDAQGVGAAGEASEGKLVFRYRWGAAARPSRKNVRRAHQVLSRLAATKRMMKRLGL